MIAPLYKDEGASRRLEDAGNLGLWYTRFFDRYDNQHRWSLDKVEAKRGWIETEARSGRAPEITDQVAEYGHRHYALVRAARGDLRDFEISWHFATGLGLPHPVENSIAWHPTLGLPYLTATGIQGLLAAWLDLVRRDEDHTAEKRAQAERRADRWCGSNDRAGTLIFFDAVPSKRIPELSCDIMTPHMGDWYADGGTIEDVDREPKKVPADWHSPIPIPFLVVENGTFLFAIAPRPGADHQGRNPTEEVAAALGELGQALEILGAGAKTAVGYGRFQSASNGLLNEIKTKEDEIDTTKRAEEERAKLLESFDGFEPSISDLLGHNDPLGLTTIVLKEIAESVWSSKDRQRLAQILKRWMIDRGEWQSNARKKLHKRIRKIQNTLRVMDLLGEP